MVFDLQIAQELYYTNNLGPGPLALERPSLDLDQITLGALSLGPHAIYCLHSCDISSPSLDIGEIPLGLRPRDISLKYLSASPRGISGGITLMSQIPKCNFTYKYHHQPPMVVFETQIPLNSIFFLLLNQFSGSS